MDRQDRIDELIDRWEEHRAAGESLSPEELCQGCPELLEEVRSQIRALEWVPSPPLRDEEMAEMLSFSSCDPGGRREDHPPVPAMLGRYRLESPLGYGGFGQVWRAFDPELERYVAIKIPRADPMTGAADADRFLEEARKVAQLRHPGIVPVHDVGHQGQWCYIVSELIEGENLARHLVRQPLSWPEAVRIVAQVADHLHYAHEHGFIHRDVKPANILLDHDGSVFLADFGIAVTQEQLQEERGSSGTLAYMSPEQARGEIAGLDRRTDVFSLGVVLYELLAGRRPFAAQSPHELHEQILQANPLPPRKLVPAIPAQLDEVCLRALAKDPSGRYPTAAALAQALQDVGLGKHHRRTITMIGGVSAVIVMLAVAVYLGASAWRQSAPSRNEGSEQARSAAVAPISLRGPDGKPTLPPGAPPPAVAPFAPQQAKEHQAAWARHLGVAVETTNSIGMKLVLIPPGEFLMGSPQELIKVELRRPKGDDWYRKSLPSEGPQHPVRITRPYWLGMTEVTQEHYQRVMGSNPSAIRDPKRPVEQVTWDEAVKFCRRLSELPQEKAAKRRYGLPTEAQWEQACRAGTMSVYYFGDRENRVGDYAWYGGKGGEQSHAVGEKEPNAFGLCDMYGNVWEWCADWHDPAYYANSPTDDPRGPAMGTTRVLRGGSWCNHAWFCRSAYRSQREPGALNFLGFRVAAALAE